MLSSILTCLILVVRFLPNTYVAQFLQKEVVDRIVRHTCDLGRVDLIKLVVLVALASSASGMIAIFGSDFLFAYSLDLSVYIDGLLVSATLTALARMATVIGINKTRPAAKRANIRPLTRPRARNSRSSQSANLASNDDEHRRYRSACVA